MSRLFALIPAGGGGSRAGLAVPKQYHALLGKPMIVHTIERLASALPLAGMFVATAPRDDHYAMAIGARHGVEPLPCGGPTRAATVANALAMLTSRCASDDWILVHDAARPCVPVEAVRRLVDTLGGDPVGGLLAVPVVAARLCRALAEVCRRRRALTYRPVFPLSLSRRQTG